MADHEDALEATTCVLRDLKVHDPMRSFHILTGPDPDIDGRGWLYAKTRDLFCPDHAGRGHLPERPDWQPGDTTMVGHCQCGAIGDGLRPTSLEAANTWWRDHVRAAIS